MHSVTWLRDNFLNLSYDRLKNVTLYKITFYPRPLFDEVDHVRLVQSHNGGIAHSYTLPHNLAGAAGNQGKAQGIVQQYMMQQQQSE